MIPERSFSAGGYRFGFNGKEKDDEVKGAGNSLDIGARIYDNRLGRWSSVDALASKYPALSSYTYVDNSPLINIDPDGRAIKPLNQDAIVLVNTVINSYGGDKFRAALKITTVNGVIKSNEFNNVAKLLTPKEFKSALKVQGITIANKQEFKSAYNLYNMLAEKLTEVAVFQKGSENSTYSPGEKGTTLINGENPSTNSNYRKFSEAFERDNNALDKVTNNKGYGTLNYEPENPSDPDLTHKGTIIIDATGEDSPAKSVENFKNSLDDD